MLYQSTLPPTILVIHFHSADKIIKNKIKVDTILSFNSSEPVGDPEKLILICLSSQELLSYPSTDGKFVSYLSRTYGKMK